MGSKTSRLTKFNETLHGARFMYALKQLISSQRYFSKEFSINDTNDCNHFESFTLNMEILEVESDHRPPHCDLPFGIKMPLRQRIRNLSRTSLEARLKKKSSIQ
jgi:hypothetical protein